MFADRWKYCGALDVTNERNVQRIANKLQCGLMIKTKIKNYYHKSIPENT